MIKKMKNQRIFYVFILIHFRTMEILVKNKILVFLASTRDYKFVREI